MAMNMCKVAIGCLLCIVCVLVLISVFNSEPFPPKYLKDMSDSETQKSFCYWKHSLTMESLGVKAHRNEVDSETISGPRRKSTEIRKNASLYDLANEYKYRIEELNLECGYVYNDGLSMNYVTFDVVGGKIMKYEVWSRSH